MPIRLLAISASLFLSFVTFARAQTLPATPTTTLTTPTTTLTDDLVVIADFEPGRPVTVALNSGSAVIGAGDGPGGAAQGKRYMRLTPKTAEAGRTYARLPLPDDAQLFAHDRLTAQLRTPAQAQVKLTWIAIDAQRKPIFQHRVHLEPGEQWVRLESPLRAWFWDTRRIADWDEVKEIVLRIDSANVPHVDLDDVRLEGRLDPDAHTTWLLDIAFGAERPRDVVSADGLMVATEAVDAFDDADLNRLLDDMQRTRAFVRRVFGDAVRPTDDIARPAMLLIFNDDDRRAAFLQRLGEAWSATIARSTAQGYTIQDSATVTYDPKLGTRRPVYLHESVHAVVARDLRLLTGHAPHTPLQEGLATYVQLCVHPGSIERGAYAKAFAQPIDPAGKGFFKPLEQLFSTRATTAHYAQLAGVVAYLIENDPDLLRDLARSLAVGQTAAEVLERRQITWDGLQDRWLTWGRAHFAKPPGAHPATIFTPPPEFE